MALNSYAALQTLILRYLRRPGDTLISGDIPDMISLFEREADRRLRTKWNETTMDLEVDPSQYIIQLPNDFRSLRSIRFTGGSPILNLYYMTPEQVSVACGNYFTIEGLDLRIADNISYGPVITIGYMKGLTPLSNIVASNWLLENHPDAYLFGSLAEAEAFVGNDERVANWLARRETVFLSIIDADRHARWDGSTLQMRPDTMTVQGRASSGGVVVTTITLNPNATTTTLLSPALHDGSFVHLSPLTQSAAQSQALGVWITATSGQATINHVSYDATDQNFSVLIR